MRPSEINSIPELRGESQLKELVATLNNPHRPFMTHGCAKANRRPDDSGSEIPLSEQSKSAEHWCTSYVTFSFWQLCQNKPENYVDLCDQFTMDANGTEVCFVIQAAYFSTLFERQLGRKWSDTNSTVCLVWVSGWGDSDAIAHSRWRNVIKSLIAFFGDDKKFPDHTGVVDTTVSQHMMIAQHFDPTETD